MASKKELLEFAEEVYERSAELLGIELDDDEEDAREAES